MSMNALRHLRLAFELNPEPAVAVIVIVIGIIAFFLN
jgi:hypothetical protein